jgi:hypothetical protein
MGATAKQQFVWMGAVLCALTGCGDDAVTSDASGCVVGQAIVCACDNGTNGAQLCGRDGRFGGCFCTGPAPSVDSGIVGQPARDAGPKAGNSGAAGGGMPGTGAAGSTGAAGAAGAGRGGSGAGSGGAAGGVSKGGSGGSGSAGKGGAGGSGGSGGGSSGGTGGTLSSAYTRCTSGDLCPDGSLCLDPNQGGGNTLGYCAPECETNADGTVSDCPQPTSGNVDAFCLPFANLCVLDSCDGDEARCPRGMTCSDGNSGPGNQQPSCIFSPR